uniref:Uncharacterized protein n=1 Tax=Strigamia maritima TaxID=126957 RepID=T1ILY9_STRMM
MNSFLALFVLVCVAVAVNGLDKCFKEDELKKHTDEMKMKKFAPIIKKCNDEKADSTEADLKACGMRLFKEAMETCEKENPKNDKTTNMYCAVTKLGIECSEDEKNFDKFKAMTLGLVLDDKKKMIEDAIAPCAKETHFHMCTTKILKEHCSESLSMYDRKIKL